MSEKNVALSPVQEFYKGKTIFITGGSGFMGKVLIEKLLYSCSDLKEILLLMRPKRGKVPEARIDDMFKLPIFQRIKDEKPEVLKKLIPIQGDVTFDALGLSGEQMKRVCNDTSIVFHCAATLRLEGNLKDALEMNTIGTKRVLDLCNKMTNLKVMIHLSTAFCCCDQDILLEKIYDCHHNPHDIMRCAEWMDVKMLEKITPNLLYPHPNTYTYSKRLAEILVQEKFSKLPVVIVRPSIVSPAWKEPIEGWVDSLNGPVGIMVGAAKGIIRSLLCDGEHRSETIPVDMAISGLITIAWQTNAVKEKPKSIPVYNLTCIESKKTRWSDVLKMAREINFIYPFEAGIWYPNGSITTSPIVQKFNEICFHWTPAILIDFLMFCFGQKRFMCRIQNRVSTGLEVLQFFTTRKWDFRSENFEGLYKALDPKDKKLFDMDMEPVDAEEYLKRSILGGRQYCMKEPLSTIPKARMQMKILYVVDVIAKLLLLFFFFWALLTFSGFKEDFINLFTKSDFVRSN